MVAQYSKGMKDDQDGSRRACDRGEKGMHNVGEQCTGQNGPSTASHVKDFTVPY